MLVRALLGVLRQVDVEVEPVIVDDGSTRPVRELFAAEALSRMTIIRHDRPEGVAAARNAGIAAASGQWIAFLDDDDLWAPQKLATELHLGRAADAEFVFISGYVIDIDGQVLRTDDAPGEVSDFHRMTLAANPVPCGSSNVLVRASLAREIGGFDPALSILADWDFSIRAAAAARVAVGPQRLIAYTVHAGGMHRDERSVADELLRFDRKHAQVRAATGVSRDMDWWLSWRAATHALGGGRWPAARAYWRLARVRRSPALAVSGALALAGGPAALAAARRLRSRSRAPRQLDVPPWLASALEPPDGAFSALVRADRRSTLQSS